MAKGLPNVNLYLAEAQSCLSIAKTLLAEQLHEDDRKKIDELLERVDSKIDSANAVIGNLRSRLDDISDQL